MNEFLIQSKSKSGIIVRIPTTDDNKLSMREYKAQMIKGSPRKTLRVNKRSIDE